MNNIYIKSSQIIDPSCLQEIVDLLTDNQKIKVKEILEQHQVVFEQ